MLQYTNFITRTRLSLGVVLASAAITFSCQHDGNEIEMIAHQIKENNCRIDIINEHVDHSWTNTLDRLDKMIPQNLPDQERDRMLVLKNADLLRMFKSYPGFSDDVHMLVDSMENVDYVLADSVRNLSLQNQQMEMKIDSLFSLIQDPEKEEMLYQKIEEIKAGDCEQMAVSK